jgi:hypothetical protein
VVLLVVVVGEEDLFQVGFLSADVEQVVAVAGDFQQVGHLPVE